MSNRDASGRQVILDTDIGWPNGITYDMQGNRLIWCDARLDKIESCDLDGGGRKILLDSTHGTFHPFGVIVYKSTVIWSDWVLKGVGIEEPDNQTWPGLYSSVSIIAQPSGIHVVVDSCSGEPCTYGTCHPLGVSDYECDCMTGFTGKDCDTVDSCSAEPCTYGTCHPLGVSDYECDCMTGFIGKDCDTVDSCYAEPCTFGTCHPLSVFDYECDCVTGFTGKDCDTAITCALPIESEESHIKDPKDLYTPGEQIIITCINDGNASTTWICNASSGSWDATEDLKCPGWSTFQYRKLYWTDWGSTPKIEMSNRDGSGRQMILDTDLEWPNGITYDMQGNRLIWCDARLDKIESCDLDGGGRKILLDITHGTFHPFDVIVYKGTVMWSDWVLKGVGIEEPGNHTWPGLYSSVSIIAQPSGIHVVVDSCSAEPCTYGTCHPLGVSDYECDCLTGVTGKDCDTVDSCFAEPCTYGTCHPLGVSDYECDCVTGFTGKDCDTGN
eukprot:XP_011666327.1 PREDICTED: low-density lipoprotein receptor-related protein 4-like [Strongylocentrotus purpuratus]